MGILDEPNRNTPPSELLELIVRNRLAEMNCCVPARVETYDNSEQKVSVKPLIKKKVSGQIISLPVIPSVPVVFPRAGRAFISLPIKKGDYVLLLFSDRSLDSWLNQGGEVDPQDERTHHLTDAVAFPGIHPFSDPIPNTGSDNLVVGLESGQATLEIEPNGNVNIQAQDISVTGNDVTVNAADAVVEASSVKLGSAGASEGVALGDVLKTFIDAFVLTFNAHTHLYSPGPGGPTPTATPVPVQTPAPTLASSKVSTDP